MEWTSNVVCDFQSSDYHPPPQEVTGQFATTSVTTVVLGAFSDEGGGGPSVTTGVVCAHCSSDSAETAADDADACKGCRQAGVARVGLCAPHRTRTGAGSLTTATVATSTCALTTTT
eukprot:scaffold49137_cov34-Phaeocystis_antarctica.AAC.3